MFDRNLLLTRIDACRDDILAAERTLWQHPESGYREWTAHAYLKEKYEALGYTLHEAGNIPGFWCELDTGRPGPCVGLFGELDSLIVPSHPEADPVTGAVHACGHNCQSAGLYGIAAAFSAPGALEGLCGKIRLFAVPAEELIEIEYREKLRADGVIRFFGGKQEFMARGYLDDVDIGIMIHTSGGTGLSCDDGSNGCVIKRAVFRGRACHAASPSGGVNALYAANTAMTAANALRETFRDEDYIRFHPIITSGGIAVNSIPDTVTVESYVRGRTLDAIEKVNRRINRAFAAPAAAMGCRAELYDHHGYAPRLNDNGLQELMKEVAEPFFAPGEVKLHTGWGKGCSDFGDVACVMPAIHPHIGGACGTGHGADYMIKDPDKACVTSAKVQVLMTARLLENDGAEARKIITGAKVPFASIPDYLKSVERVELAADAVSYGEDGTVTLKFVN